MNLEIFSKMNRTYNTVDLETLTVYDADLPLEEEGKGKSMKHQYVKALSCLPSKNINIILIEAGNIDELYVTEHFSFDRACQINNLFRILKGQNIDFLLSRINPEKFKFLMNGYLIQPLKLSLLHYAAYMQDVAILRKILSLSDHFGFSPVFISDQSGRNPLMIALDSGNMSILHMLIKLFLKEQREVGCCPWLNRDFLSRILKLNQSFFYELFKIRFIEREFQSIIQGDLNKTSVSL